MSAVRDAIRSTLQANTSLASLLGDGSEGIYYGKAKDNAKYPCVILSVVPGTGPMHFFSGNPLEQRKWLVKGCGPKAADVEQIDELVRGTLTRAKLNISGYTNNFCMPVEDVQFTEVEDGQRFEYAGAVYDIRFERSSS